MNENLENLRLKAGQLSLAEHKNWDELVAVWTELIDREQETNAKALAYLSRGAAYNYRGDHDLAIADFDEALRLAPSDRMMKFMGLFYRGDAYLDKGDYDQAIGNFDEALALELPDIATQSIGLFFHRGVAYIKKGNHDKAIANFTKALELNPNYANAYLCRGFVYIDKENFPDASKDFKKAAECDSILKVEVPAIYVAIQITDIYKDRAEEDGGKIFELYFRLLEAISNIRQNQFYAPQENAEVAHYTSLHTLKSLADNGRFRLYNAAYMNDPEEGRVFFEIMNRWTDIDIDIEGSFYRDNKLHPSPAYIGSFVKVDAKTPKQKEELFLWRTYGKHDGQEAAGACLIFKHEGTVFAEKCGAQIGAMQQLQSKLLLAEDDRQIPEEKQPGKPDLYKIVYSDENLKPFSPAELLSLRGYSDEGTNRGLSKELKKLAESLKQIKKHTEEEKGNVTKEKLRELVRDLLDTIRFLFKARHYREEKEVRVVQVRYDEENTTQDEDGIHVDTKQIPPRFYLETQENFRFSEVILGPQTRGVPEWKRWLKKRDIKVDQSEIHYGKSYP